MEVSMIKQDLARAQLLLSNCLTFIDCYDQEASKNAKSRITLRIERVPDKRPGESGLE